jgi:AcrR family transcriptional regulator
MTAETDGRRHLLAAHCLDYLLRHGIAGASLRPLGAASGTSARMLVYHFGSREGVLTAAMDLLRHRMQTSLTAGGGRHRVRSGSPLRAFWRWVSGEGRPYVRLLFEVHVLALQRPREFAPYLDRTSRSWIAAIEQMLPPSRDRRVRATLCAAVVDGLLLELLSTGDHRRTSAALVTFERLLHRQARGR